MGIDDADTVFQVVINEQDQYSVWFADRAVLHGLVRHRPDREQAGVPQAHREGLDRYASPLGSQARCLTTTTARTGVRT